MTLENTLEISPDYFVRRNLEDLLKPTDAVLIPVTPIAAVPIFY